MSDSKTLKEEKIESKEIYRGRLLHVFKDEVRLPNGHTSTREWIKHPGAAAVVPVFADGGVMMIRQYRYPVGQVLYEVPAGKIDPGEAPEKTAARELKEEVGLISKHLHLLGPYHPSIGYSDEVIRLYCGWDLDRTVEEDEFIEPVKVPFRETVGMIYDGAITDGKSIAALLRAWHWWQQKGPFEI